MKRMITALLFALCLTVSVQQTALAFPVHNLVFASPLVAAINITVPPAKIVKPGPPPTIEQDNWYYKAFNTKAQADAIENQWRTVENNGGIPVPQHGVENVKVTIDGQQKPNLNWAFRSKKVSGTFFQVQKAGKLKPMFDWVAVQTDKIVLTRVRDMFTYAKSNMGDAQGFVEIKPGIGINFIDINTPGTSPKAQEVIDAINQKLNDLQ